MFFDSMMPRDPFADDPNDPASFIEDDELPQPLTPEEREAVLRDLAQTREFKLVLEPRGILGITFLCEDCEEMHFYDWDIMINNMIAILNSQLPPVHEPSAQPNFQAYVPWDYALGYLDGLDAR